MSADRQKKRKNWTDKNEKLTVKLLKAGMLHHSQRCDGGVQNVYCLIIKDKCDCSIVIVSYFYMKMMCIFLSVCVTE